MSTTGKRKRLKSRIYEKFYGRPYIPRGPRKKDQDEESGTSPQR